MSKKRKYNLSVILVSLVIVGFLALVLVIAYQSIPDPGHGGDKVFIRINNLDKDLQSSINAGDFDNCVSGNDGDTYTGEITSGHKGEDIIVNLNDNPINLQTAINTGLLTSATSGGDLVNFGTISLGQTGSQIKITIKGNEKTLQEAINSGDFKCTPVKTGYELNYLAGCTWCNYFDKAWAMGLVCSPSTVKVQVDNSQVMPGYCTTTSCPVYSANGNWNPTSTYQDSSSESLKIGVTGISNGLVCSGSTSPKGGYYAVYRIYKDNKVKIKSYLKGYYYVSDEGGANLFPSAIIDRLDIFQKVGNNILVTDSSGKQKSYSLEEGKTLVLDYLTWCDTGPGRRSIKPFCDGSPEKFGHANITLYNAKNYFEVHQYVFQESLPSGDNDKFEINSYIESA